MKKLRIKVREEEDEDESTFLGTITRVRREFIGRRKSQEVGPTFWPQRWYVSKSLIVEARTRVCWFGLLFCSALLLCSELNAVLAPFTEYRCCRPVLSNW